MIRTANRVALYARFSSDNQRTESIDAQIRAMKAYCQQRRFVIVNTYIDEAKSATTDRRPAFQQMIADSKDRNFNILLVHKLDRFARNRYDSAVYKRELKKNGVTVYSVLENLDDSPESIMMESVLEGMSEYYSQNLAREVMKGMRETALQGKHTGGNALGTLSFSQTSGAVSATDRSISMSDGTVISNMIQTDCSINSGNSGGPLFDSYGRVAGIVSAKYSNNGDASSASIEGIGFAIPINDVKQIITDYMEHGYVTGRPSMGVTVTPVEVDYQQLFGWPAGLYVNSVESGSCAEKAGIKMGDIITKLGDTEVTTMGELTAAKNQFKAGETTTVTLYRAGETLAVSIIFDEQSNTPAQPENTQNPQGQNPQNGNNGYGYGYNYGNGNNGYGNNGYGYFDPWSFFFGGGY